MPSAAVDLGSAATGREGRMKRYGPDSLGKTYTGVNPGL